MSWERFTIGTDNHGDMQDDATVEAFLEHVGRWRPKHRVHLGDIWDFRPLRKKASDEEKREGLQPDMKAGVALLRRYRPTLALQGNHDWRPVLIAAEKSGIVSEVCGTFVQKITDMLAARGCPWLPYDKRYGIGHLGNLNLLHGFGGYTQVMQSAHIYGPCAMGHLHTEKLIPLPSLTPKSSWLLPGLCKEDLGYDGHLPSTLQHCCGWGDGMVNSKTGEFQLWVTRKTPTGKFVTIDSVTIL